ncbi:DNA/RNA non-specific endonuclease [Bacillus atrophaeus]|uniref:DNA/RNA non-specific endonuclease n=1 Tax=Bacillus atrophaeus TaxID=1452 RepID=UPI00227FB9E6|nr:DNA/RNA non-specific endonuclease [Bacillus atrophaeus]MCY8818658.1 DNA/RNA non-specific endonuclease [Bacillus atrophaeus]
MSIGKGYDINFLGEDYIINPPRLVGKTLEESLNDGEIFNFTNFSLVMNKKRRFLIYGANNVDKNLLKDIKRDNDDWHFDLRIGKENQVGNELYRNNPWDRGHMVRRRDVCWGTWDEAKAGNNDSFCWANIVLQHCEINTKIWNDIEEWMLNYNDNMLNKLSVFTGPIFTMSDRPYCGENQNLSCGIQIPAGFWKVLFYVDLKKKLRSVAFVIKQDDFWYDNRGRGFKPLETYQVPLNSISEMTGIEFENRLYRANPLLYFESNLTKRENIQTPEAHPISSMDDLILDRELT